MITIKEIAERANVSRTTVSRVLNDSGYVSEDARKRVLHVIEETGYVPSAHAKSLRTKKQRLLGLFCRKSAPKRPAVWLMELTTYWPGKAIRFSLLILIFMLKKR